MKVKGPKKTIEVERKKRTSGGHTLTMNKTEMAEYMEKCAVLTGYPLPTTEELMAMGYIPNDAPDVTRPSVRPNDYLGEPTI
jgi:hypothetical protein